jgi:hypothetical protein
MLCIDSRRLALPAMLTAALASGCATDDTTAENEEETDPAVTTTEQETGSEGETGTEEPPPPTPIELVEARGISITKVEANQGVEVDIAIGDDWQGPLDRNAALLTERDTYVRVHFEVDEATWEPREIWGRLTIFVPDEEPVVSEIHQLVEKNPDPRYRDETINFGILAEHATPSTEFRIELFEAAPAAEQLEPGITVTPGDGPGIVGYESDRSEMKITLVPIDYRGIPEPTLPDLNDENLQIIADGLYQQNPLHELKITVHEPYVYEPLLTNLGTLLGHMSALKSEDGAGPNEYYHALVEVGTPAVNHVAGIAQLTGDDKGASGSRVAATVWLVPAGSTETLVHEVGHNQGLNHVYCPNQATEAAGPDPNYPNQTGKITVYGFGIRNYLVYSTNGSHDYMTYCANSWVSDWTWTKTRKRIKTLTSWDYEEGAGAGQSSGVLLYGAIFGDGTSDWWTGDGNLDARVPSANHRLEVQVDGETMSLPATIGEVDHGDVYWVISELPEDAVSVESIAHLHDGVRNDIDVGGLRYAHSGRVRVQGP